jgi:hypothetical protein
LVFFITHLRNFIYDVLIICAGDIGSIVVLRLDLLHLSQHLLCTVLFHTRCLIHHARRPCLGTCSRVCALGLLEEPVLRWRLRHRHRGRIRARSRQPLHRFSLPLPVLPRHLLLLPTVRTDRVVFVLGFRTTAVFLSIEQPRIGVIALLHILVRRVDGTRLPLLRRNPICRHVDIR